MTLLSEMKRGANPSKRITVPLTLLALNKSRKFLINSNKRSICAFLRGEATRNQLVQVCKFNGIPYAGRTVREIRALIDGEREEHKYAQDLPTTISAIDAQNSIIVRGRSFSKKEILKISKIVIKYYSSGRTCISHLVCDAIDWRQENGWPKARACRSALAKLANDKLIPKLPNLPKRKSAYFKSTSAAIKKSALIKAESIASIHRSDLITPVSLSLIKNSSDSELWKAMVTKYHYLGYTVSVGRSARFFIRDGSGEILGAICLSDSSWASSIRDSILMNLGIGRQQTANNTRFLILPNVRIKNLASQALSLLATDGVRAWENYYASNIHLIETYVDPSKYSGGCYRAANWFQVGLTRGFSKRGSRHVSGGQRKILFLYPTHPTIRKKLKAILTQKQQTTNEQHYSNSA